MMTEPYSDPALYPALDAVRALVDGRGLSAFVLTFGCQQNEADSEKLS